MTLSVETSDQQKMTAHFVQPIVRSSPRNYPTNPKLIYEEVGIFRPS